MTLQQRVDYLELCDRNNRMLIESQGKFINGLAKIIEDLLMTKGYDSKGGSNSALQDHTSANQIEANDIDGNVLLRMQKLTGQNYDSELDERVKYLEKKLSEIEKRHSDEGKESGRAREAMIKAAREGIK